MKLPYIPKCPEAGQCGGTAIFSDILFGVFLILVISFCMYFFVRKWFSDD